MSLAVAQGTNLFIVMRKAQIEYRLMQITSELQQLALHSAQESADLLNRYQVKAAYEEDTDDVSVVAADVMTGTEFTTLYNNMTLQYNAKEKILTTEKKKLETEEQALDTMADGVNKMITSNIKSFKYFQ